MKQNITFDFTQGVEQIEVAVMPAHLATKLLKMYAESLVKASVEEIVGEFIDNLRAVKKDGLPVVIDVAREWVDERTLIHNISNNKWDVYAVQQEISKPDEEDIINGLSWYRRMKQLDTTTEDTSIMGDVPSGVKVIGKINLDDTFGGPHESLTGGI